jgi:hypothetical protein
MFLFARGTFCEQKVPLALSSKKLKNEYISPSMQAVASSVKKFSKVFESGGTGEKTYFS